MYRFYDWVIRIGSCGVNSVVHGMASPYSMLTLTYTATHLIRRCYVCRRVRMDQSGFAQSADADATQFESREKSTQYPGTTTGWRMPVELQMKGGGFNDAGFGHSLQFGPCVP